jgi:hypothetical protein
MLAKRDFTSLGNRLGSNLTIPGPLSSRSPPLVPRSPDGLVGLIYTLVAATLPPAHYWIRSQGAGLAGVWWVYVWFQISRVVGFAWRGGLLRRGLWAQAATSEETRGAAIPSA